MRPKKCMAHLHGVSVGSRRFYTPGCPTCEAKRARGLCGPGDPLQPQSLAQAHRERGQAAFGKKRRLILGAAVPNRWGRH